MNNTNKEIELISYEYQAPFHIHNIEWEGELHSPTSLNPNILEHWHPDYEFVLTKVGNAVHYIDGHPFTAHPGEMLVVNSESIHKVISDIEHYQPGETVAIVLHINYEYLLQMIPDLPNLYFINETGGRAFQDDPILDDLMTELSQYADNGSKRPMPGKIPDEGAPDSYIFLHIMSLVYEVVYRLSQNRLVSKEKAFPINSAKNLERLRGVMQYVEAHYSERLTQSFIAKKFHFTSEYFARFFKKNTGLTFIEYLNRYRVIMARDMLLSSDRNVMDIALDCGFSDARGLINVFRREYGMTPLQYRKACAK